MSIRKTASGQVLGTEGDQGITKTAATGWEPEDEKDLLDETTEADGAE
jgi:hypothetical protein